MLGSQHHCKYSVPLKESTLYISRAGNQGKNQKEILWDVIKVSFRMPQVSVSICPVKDSNSSEH